MVHLPSRPAPQAPHALFPDGHLGGWSAERVRVLDMACPSCHAILIGSSDARTFALISRDRSSSTNGSETNVVMLNSFHPSLKLTLERTDPDHISSVSFLDTLITVSPSGKFGTELLNCGRVSDGPWPPPPSISGLQHNPCQ